jgi:L-2,4-diaminobutyrate transaminase
MIRTEGDLNLGANGQAVTALDRGFHLHPFASVAALQREDPLVIRRAHGVIIEDESGREMIDAAAGLWCVNVGYGRREIIDAVYRQMGELAFFHSFGGMTHAPVARLAERVIGLAPAGMRRAFFGNSGSDANDTAMKLVALYNNLRGKPDKKKIISRLRGYHGVTIGAGSLTGLASVHRLFDLPLSNVVHVEPPDTYREPGLTGRDYAERLDAAIEAAGPETVAAFIAEPVIGTGGVLVPPDDYFIEVREVLDRHDVLLILDEVICGFGRLGTWFGANRFGVSPDIMTVAKGLTSSYLPMSAVIVGDRVWSVMDARKDSLGVFGHGFTTTGHPAAAAAAYANLDIIERENLVARAGELGRHLITRLRAQIADHPLVGDIRGCGLMVGIELVEDKTARRNFAPERGIVAKVQRAAIEERLLVRALPSNDVIAMSPPFIIEPPDLDACVTRLARALDRVASDINCGRA